MNELPISINYTVWYLNTFFYLFMSVLVLLIAAIVYYHRRNIKKNSEIKLLQQQYLAKIDNIRKDHADKVENLRIDMLRLEEDKNRQWMESEKETLHVLNGVSTLLDLSEKINRVESDKVLAMLQEIRDKVENIIQSNNINSHGK